MGAPKSTDDWNTFYWNVCSKGLTLFGAVSKDLEVSCSAEEYPDMHSGGHRALCTFHQKPL